MIVTERPRLGYLPVAGSEARSMGELGFFSTKPMKVVPAALTVGVGVALAFGGPMLVKAGSAKVAFASIGSFVTAIGILNLIDSISAAFEGSEA